MALASCLRCDVIDQPLRGNPTFESRAFWTKGASAAIELDDGPRPKDVFRKWNFAGDGGVSDRGQIGRRWNLHRRCRSRTADAVAFRATGRR
jgi:hypothetical protein